MRGSEGNVPVYVSLEEVACDLKPLVPSCRYGHAYNCPLVNHSYLAFVSCEQLFRLIGVFYLTTPQQLEKHIFFFGITMDAVVVHIRCHEAVLYCTSAAFATVMNMQMSCLTALPTLNYFTPRQTSQDFLRRTEQYHFSFLKAVAIKLVSISVWQLVCRVEVNRPRFGRLSSHLCRA